MIEYFSDPVLAAPTIGSMLMCLLAGLVGTFAVLKRQSLVGETLSHACYPGVIAALLITKCWFDFLDDTSLLLVPIIGATCSCLLGMYLIEILSGRFRISTDSALCFVLASFFGIALVILSSLQGSFPTLYKELQGYLFGQAATQTNAHIVLYGTMTAIAIACVVIFYRPIKVVIFDPEYAKTIGIDCDKVNFLLLGIIVIAVVVGIRTLGVVLMSAMLIFPSVSGRFWTTSLTLLLVLSCLFGLLSGFFGVYISHEVSLRMTKEGHALSMPTGPTIVLVGAILFLFSALCSPQKGLLFRIWRRLTFWSLCQQENLLKAIWKHCSAKNSPLISHEELERLVQARYNKRNFMLSRLIHKGWLKSCGAKGYELSAAGMLWGRKIVRLHRLWEVYLVEYCGVGKDRVHPSAEEMEHIITPEIEAELDRLLHYPHQDPHHQPIPSQEVHLLQP